MKNKKHKPDPAKAGMSSLLVLCNHCKTLLMSKYSGQYISCQCGKCMVDQTEHYTRYGGAPEDFQLFNITVDWSKCDKPFSRQVSTWPYGVSAAVAEQLFAARIGDSHTGRKSSKESSTAVSSESKAQKMVRSRKKKQPKDGSAK